MRAIRVIALLSVVGFAMSSKSTIRQKLAQTGMRQDAAAPVDNSVAAAPADNLVVAVAAPVAASAAVTMPSLDPSALSDLSSVDDGELNTGCQTCNCGPCLIPS